MNKKYKALAICTSASLCTLSINAMLNQNMAFVLEVADMAK